MTPPDDHCRAVDQQHPDDDWTLNERLLVLWDRAAVRWLVAAFVAALVVAVFALMRAAPGESLSATVVTATGSAPPTASAQPSNGLTVPSGVTSPEPSQSGAVIVDVVGRVRSPGVVTLPTGSRVADALEAAGGLTKGKTLINLARVLIDGEQINVAARADAVANEPSGSTPGAEGGSVGSSTKSALVNLNTASKDDLEELPRVGPVTAGRIIDFRAQYGGFRSVDQLMEVSGVGQVTFAGLAPLVTV
jgi:competence protein ComEA